MAGAVEVLKIVEAEEQALLQVKQAKEGLGMQTCHQKTVVINIGDLEKTHIFAEDRTHVPGKTIQHRRRKSEKLTNSMRFMTTVTILI